MTAPRSQQPADARPSEPMRIETTVTGAMGPIDAPGDVDLAKGANDGAQCRALGSITAGGPIRACTLSAGRNDALDGVAAKATETVRSVLAALANPVANPGSDEDAQREIRSHADRLVASAMRLLALLEPGRRASIRASETIQAGATLAGQGWTATFTDDLIGPLEIAQSDEGVAMIRRPDGSAEPLDAIANVTHDDPSPATFRAALHDLERALGPASEAA